MNNKVIKAIEKNLSKFCKNGFSLEKELTLIDRLNFKVICIEEDAYPELLKRIYKPPELLYVKGNMGVLNEFCIGIVGSRRASLYGTRQAHNLSAELSSRNVCVVSGMARGIDAHAHRGAIKVSGKTIAVMGSGLCRIYPPEHEELMEKISERGAVISEFPLNTPPYKFNFPMRNRIISGLSFGVCVVEASKKSGALITADMALEQNREVFAVPGKIDSALSKGTLNLIKEGAKLVEDADDILEEFSDYQFEKKKEPSSDKSKVDFLSGEEKRIYNFLKEDPVHSDELQQVFSLPVKSLSATLLNLELKRLIKQVPGRKYIKT